MKELSERYLNIPAAIARKYAARASNHGIDEEELVSAGYLALVEAARAFDLEKSAQGESGFGPFLVQRVEWRVRHAIWPSNTAERGRAEFRSRSSSLDAGPVDDAALHAVVGRDDEFLASVEKADESAEMLSRLSRFERAAVTLAARDLTERQIGELLGVSKSTINLTLARVRRKATLSARARDAQQESGYHPVPPRMPRQEWEAQRPARDRALRKAKAQEPIARRALGVVALMGWYLACHETRRLWGDWPTATAAFVALGIATKEKGKRHHVSAALGWPGLVAGDAEVLVALMDGPIDSHTLAARMKRSVKCVTCCVCRLAKVGLAKSNNYRGPGIRAVYSITEEAISRRGPTTSLVPIRGKQATKLAAEGYEVLPPHLIGASRAEVIE